MIEVWCSGVGEGHGLGEAGEGDGWEDEGLEMEVGTFHTAIFVRFGGIWIER